MRIHEPRKMPADRVKAGTENKPSVQSKTFLAPSSGLVTNANLVGQQPLTAVVLENFWPTSEGLEPRGGLHKRFDIGSKVTALFEYAKGATHKLFVTDENNVYPFDKSTADDTALVADITGQTSGDYSVLGTETAGGNFLTIANGSDFMQIFNGTTWQQITDVSAPHSITGVVTSDISYIWNYRSRTFMIEAGSLNAWYLGINSVSGVAEQIPLSSVFNKAGELVFGGTLSGDSGAGIDDRCVFVTDQGEFAIFTGGNPASASDWSLVGVYDLGKPLGKSAHFKSGGDLIVATESGMIPLSAAVRVDRSELKQESFVYSIEPDWLKEVTLAGNLNGWQVAKANKKNMVLITSPLSYSDSNYCYVLNTSTKAVSKFTGWDATAFGSIDDQLYIGSSDGKIYLADTTGSDDGNPYICKVCFAFDHFEAPARLKRSFRLQASFKHLSKFKCDLSMAKNLAPNFPTAPNAATDLPDGTLWDISDWDIVDWDIGSQEEISILSKAAPAKGFTLAPQVMITSANEAKMDVKLMSVDMTYQIGGLQR